MVEICNGLYVSHLKVCLKFIYIIFLYIIIYIIFIYIILYIIFLYNNPTDGGTFFSSNIMYRNISSTSRISAVPILLMAFFIVSLLLGEDLY